MSQFEFLKILNSPFKIPRVKFYIGKVAIGTPYFHPRKLVKPTPKMAMDEAIRELTRREKWNNANPDVQFKQDIKPLDEMYKEKLRYRFPVPKKIGFDFVQLGWKTKWSETDYRFEWSPTWSFVFWKWQIALKFLGPDSMSTSHYWEAWLYYKNHTSKNKPIKTRVRQLKKQFPQTSTIYRKGKEEETINYYDIILKKKYNL
jgi:hypothetical protein